MNKLNNIHYIKILL